MALPPFAPYPPLDIRKSTLPEEWDACLDAWLLLAQGHLLISAKEFYSKSITDVSLLEFLSSYVSEESKGSDGSYARRSRDLRRECFLLTHRLLSVLDSPPPLLLDFGFLGDLCTLYARSATLKALIGSTWTRCDLSQSTEMRKSKTQLVDILENGKEDLSAELDTCLRRAGALLKLSPFYGQLLMTGSDFLDALVLVFPRNAAHVRRRLVAITYLAMVSLTESQKPNISSLLDHLYSLKGDAEKQSEPGNTQTSLLQELVSTTPFVRKLEDRLAGYDASRAKVLISYLKGIRVTDGSKQKRPHWRKLNKGKGKENKLYEGGPGGASGGVHVHKMSLITQVQDLFPDFGTGFIARLLDEYDDDTEQVISHVLEDSLPDNLRNANQKENFTPSNSHQPPILDHTPTLAPHPTPPLLPSRKNIFDNDAFDKLAISPSQIHFGRKEESTTSLPAPNKAAILSALAAFDSDEDERDDTYDVEDVGGTVDVTMPNADLHEKSNSSDINVNTHESALFAAYKLSPEIFGRDGETRRGKARAALKRETGMTDEAIEGWAVMLAREPRRLKRLEVMSSMGTSAQQQTELARSAYREGLANEESATEESDSGGGRGGYRDRGLRGRGRGRGRGGNVAGPTDDKATQIARQRKDTNKSSRANHNRRDQRARKMARGGGGMG